MIIDAKDLILGRMASFIAKRLLEGERVIIVNAEQAVISGKRKTTFDIYDAWRKIRSLVNPRKGPFHPRRPDDLVRLTVRRMLPYDKARGREAYRRLRVHVGLPSEFKEKELMSIPEASLKRLGTKRFIRLGELSRHLGARF
jgi:large subunit ribosomal protein L13